MKKFYNLNKFLNYKIKLKKKYFLENNYKK